MTTWTALAAILVVVGLVGVVVPLLPGLLLVWAGVAVWAVALGEPAGWAVLFLATLVIGAGTVAKYLLPGRRMREAGVPTGTVLAGAGAGIAGFFLIPVLGLPIGFVAGIYLVELARVGADRAWPSTREALRAIGWSILIELAAGLVATGVWVVGVIIS